MYLRHLAIVRDTVVKGKGSVFIYYTYESFKKLVEDGKAFWEAVTTTPDSVKKGKNVAAALDVVADLDEYGFSTLDATHFEGPHNGASLPERVSTINEPVLKKHSDSTSVVQEPNQSRRRSTKPLGRPRKAPKTSIAANIDKKTPEQLNARNHLQESAEKYDKIEIEREITRRIEGGEDAVLVTRKVLAERDALRNQKGEEALSQFLKAQVLHAFAGEPIPHTEIEMKRKRGRPPKKKNQIAPQYQYLPSIAAHSISFLPPTVLPTAKPIPRRKRAPKSPAEKSGEPTTPGTTSTTAQTLLFVPTREASPASPSLAFNINGEGAYPGWVNFMSKYYEPQLRALERSSDGVYVGETTPRRKRQFEPRDLRPRSFKLAVFKLSRLRNFDWFVATRESPERRQICEPRPGGASKPQDAGPDAQSDRQLPKKHQSPLPSMGCATPTPSTTTKPLALRLESDYVSPYGDTVGTKRKRGISPEPSRDPSRTGSFGRSSPGNARMGSYTKTQELKTLTEISTPPKPSGKAVATMTGEDDWFSSASSRLEASMLSVIKTLSDHVTDETPAKGDNDTQMQSVELPEHPTQVAEQALEKIEHPTQVTEKTLITPDHPTHDPGKSLEMSEHPMRDPETVEILEHPTQGPEKTPGTPEHPTRVSDKTSDKKTVGKLSRKGGSAAILRRTIVMGILEKCDGIFPSHKEMGVPFAVEWKKRGQEGAPEQRTIGNVVKSLITSGKLRQIVFSFQTHQGVVVTKSMLTLADISLTDSRIKETQTMMIASHPRYFIPTAVMSSDESKSSAVQPIEITGSKESTDQVPEHRIGDGPLKNQASLRRLEAVKNIKKGKVRAAEARLDALKAQEEKDAEIVKSRKPAAEGERIDGVVTGPERDGDAPIIRMPYVPPNPQPRPPPRPRPKQPSGKRDSGRKIERLASIRRSPNTPQALLRTKIPVSDRGALTWLPSKFAFSDADFEAERPILPELAMDHGKDHGQHPFGEEGWTPHSILRFETVGNSDQSAEEMAENTTQRKRSQAQTYYGRSPLLYGDFYAALQNSTYPRIRAPSSLVTDTAQRRKRRRKQTTATPSPHLLTSYTSEWFPVALKEYIESLQHKRQLISFMDPIHSFHPATGTFSVGFEGVHQAREFVSFSPFTADVDRTRSTLPQRSRGVTKKRVSQLRAPRSKARLLSPLFTPSVPTIVGQHVALPTNTVRKSYTQGLTPTFMDPGHEFHSATGTFSSTFSGLQPFKLVIEESPETIYEQFNFEVLSLLHWELQTEDFMNVRFEDWPFINHVFPHPHETNFVVEADVDAAFGVSLSSKGKNLVSRRFSKTKEIRSKVGSGIFSKGSKCIVLPAAKTPILSGEKKSAKRRRITSLEDGEIGNGTPEQIPLDSNGRSAKLRKIRGSRKGESIGEHDEQRLLTAVIVVRTLTGGLERRIDWVLVSKAFEPTYSQALFRDRWKTVIQKYKLMLPKMESDFQEMFAKAYEEATVPSLDFDNLAEYDWNWLVEWTMANVGTHIQSLPELPSERVEFDDLYTLKETFENDINEFYELDGISINARRNNVIHRESHVYPLSKKPRPTSSEISDLTTVKTWVRANIFTPEDTYDPELARAKLATFPEHMIEDALRQLLVDRVLTQENKGRLVPGRNYDVSEYMISRLKKNIQLVHFKCAAAYKDQLDDEFAEKGRAMHSPLADDGEMLAVLNLVAHRRITAVAIDPPMEKWGMVDGGYETRRMDKRRLDFGIELRPLPSYISGNPLYPLPSPPKQHLEDPMAKIPLWYDIHGSLLPVMWELALAAVIAVLAIRPGVGVEEIEKNVRPAMELWEVKRMLNWMVEAGAVKEMRKGRYAVEEWWWCLALGTNEGVGEMNEDINNKGKGKEKARDDAHDLVAMDFD